ncbi:MAG: hypothetical protein AB7S65_10945 [Sulfuricurvum sp.]
MVNYTESLIWLVVWPAIIYLSYRFAAFNIAHFTRMERFFDEQQGSFHADA